MQCHSFYFHQELHEFLAEIGLYPYSVYGRSTKEAKGYSL